VASKRNYQASRGSGKTIKVVCATCNGPTQHDILYTVTDEEGDENVQWWGYYQVLECRGCERVSFRHNWQSTEDIDLSASGTMEIADHETLYPSRIAGAAPMADSHLLPRQLMRIYEETHSALSANLPVLAGIGIRAIVETLCAEKNAKGRDLKEKIDDLVKQGVITPAGGEILHSLRLMGNEAAHEVKPQKSEDLLLAMRVVEHALQGVYILPRQAEHLPSGRAVEP
jgi:hypothetical protein